MYVQHDEHVQQVIDEQFLVQCWEGMEQGLVSYQDGLSRMVDKTLTKTLPAVDEGQPRGGNTKQFQRRVLDMVEMDPMILDPLPSRTKDDNVVRSGIQKTKLVLK